MNRHPDLILYNGTLHSLDVAQNLLNFMLEPAAAIAVANGQNYPTSLDPTKVAMPDEVKKLPAFDPTGKLDGYLFADPPIGTATSLTGLKNGTG